MNYVMKPPLILTHRLIPGIRIGDATISLCIERDEDQPVRTDDRRLIYHVWIDTPEWTHEDHTIQSGCDEPDNAHSLQTGLSSLLSFLSACANANDPSYGDEPGEQADLFPPHVGEWAYQNDNEIGMAQIELEETPNAIT